MENLPEEKENQTPEEEESSLELPLKLLGCFLVILFMVILAATIALPLLKVPALLVLTAVPVMLLILVGLFFAAKKCLGITNVALAKMIYFFQIVVPTVLISLYIIIAAIAYLYQSNRF